MQGVSFITTTWHLTDNALVFRKRYSHWQDDIPQDREGLETSSEKLPPCASTVVALMYRLFPRLMSLDKRFQRR